MKWWFELPDAFWSVAGIQDYFEYIIKKHEASASNPLIQIYVNRFNNKMILSEFLKPEAIK